MYRSPTCACCHEYEAILEAAGWTVEVVEIDDTAAFKTARGIPAGSVELPHDGHGRLRRRGARPARPLSTSCSNERRRSTASPCPACPPGRRAWAAMRRDRSRSSPSRQARRSRSACTDRLAARSRYDGLSVPKWRNRQTRRSQTPLRATSSGFDPRLRHHILAVHWQLAGGGQPRSWPSPAILEGAAGAAPLSRRGLGPAATLSFEISQAPAARDSVAAACWLVPEMRIPPPRFAGAMAAVRIGHLAVDRPHLIVGLQGVTAAAAQIGLGHTNTIHSVAEKEGPPRRVRSVTGARMRATLSGSIPASAPQVVSVHAGDILIVAGEHDTISRLAIELSVTVALVRPYEETVERWGPLGGSRGPLASCSW